MLSSFVKQIQGWAKLKGNTDGTLIGNVGDALKVVSPDETVVNISNQNTDLFDRVSMAEDSPLWSFAHRYGDDVDLYFDKSISGGGSFSLDANTGSQVMTNGTADTNTIEYRTYRYFEYSKGRMQSFYMALNPWGTAANVVKEWGAFDDKNGVFFRLDGTTPKLVRRTSTSGSTVDNEITQASWDDPLDGTGPSGITIDWAKYQLFYIQYAWLGGNAIEWGIFDKGVKIPVHRVGFVGSGTTAWCQSGNLPLGFKITNEAAVSAPKMDINCFAVFNNGRQSQIGEVISVDTGTTEATISTTESILAAIRLSPTENRASLRPLNFNLVSPSGNSTIFYKVEIGGSFTGDSWSDLTNSIAQGLSSYTTYTNGNVIQSGYVAAGTSVQVEEILSDLYVGRGIDGTSQVLALTAQTVNSTAKALFSGRFREYK